MSSRLGEHASILDEVERQRAIGYRQEADRRRFIAGCAVSKLILAHQLGLSANSVRLDRSCGRCGQPHGRPRLRDSDIAFSVSHSGDRVAVAFTKGGSIGVDVETLQRTFHPAELVDSVLAPVERLELSRLRSPDLSRALLTYWTRKEAILKAIGKGLIDQLPSVVVSAPHQPPKLLAYDGDRALPTSMTMAQLHPGDDYVAAVALTGQPISSVTEFDANMFLRAIL